MIMADAERLVGLFSVSLAAMVHRLHELRSCAPEDFCDSYRYPGTKNAVETSPVERAISSP